MLAKMPQLTIIDTSIWIFPLERSVFGVRSYFLALSRRSLDVDEKKVFGCLVLLLDRELFQPAKRGHGRVVLCLKSSVRYLLPVKREDQRGANERKDDRSEKQDPEELERKTIRHT